MIITKCPACAAPLAHDSPPCVRCLTRYCSETCRYDHWRRGHKHICKIISSRGGPEQIYAEKKYKEAVAEAVEACTEDVKGQTCFICTQALHWKTKEGLVRGCACRGTSGFAHVSCLAEQAKILVAEAEENNLGNKAFDERFRRWHTCSLCEQQYHGVVKCALGWACWKTYVGRPETDWARSNAMTEVGNGLHTAKRHKEALSVKEAELAMRRRLGDPEDHILVVQNNLACTYDELGRLEEALRLRKDVYSGRLKLNGKENEDALRAALNYVVSLVNLKRFEEAKAMLRKTMPVARRVLGDSHDYMLRLRQNYAEAFWNDDDATLDDLRLAVAILEGTERTARRVFGAAHPLVEGFEGDLQDARAVLRTRETPPPSEPAALPPCRTQTQSPMRRRNSCRQPTWCPSLVMPCRTASIEPKT